MTQLGRLDSPSRSLEGGSERPRCLTPPVDMSAASLAQENINFISTAEFSAIHPYHFIFDR